ncbi:MAG: hypothetical protein JWQ71_900 [Pedosphaera sp.]|nr:hypothetical protein [Pedosphaera sp.]
MSLQEIDERTGTHLVAHFNERHLRVNPMRVFCNLFHRLRGIITNQVNPLAQHHESFEKRSGGMSCKLEISRPMLVLRQFCAQGTQIIGKVFQEIIVARADVIQNPAFFMGNVYDGPFVKNDFFIPGIHLLGASFNQFRGFFNGHRWGKISSNSRNKTFLASVHHGLNKHASLMPERNLAPWTPS